MAVREAGMDPVKLLLFNRLSSIHKTHPYAKKAKILQNQAHRGDIEGEYSITFNLYRSAILKT